MRYIEDHENSRNLFYKLIFLPLIIFALALPLEFSYPPLPKASEDGVRAVSIKFTEAAYMNALAKRIFDIIDKNIELHSTRINISIASGIRQFFFHLSDQWALYLNNLLLIAVCSISAYVYKVL